jgi:hypothetical protein
LLDDRRFRIQIQEAKKHTDPTDPESDPDPQHCIAFVAHAKLATQQVPLVQSTLQPWLYIKIRMCSLSGSGCPGLRWERFPRELRPGEKAAAARRKKAAVAAAKTAAKKAKMDIAARLDQLDKLDQKEKSDDEEEEGKEGDSSGLCFLVSVLGVFAFRSLLFVAASGFCFLVSVVLLFLGLCSWLLLLASDFFVLFLVFLLLGLCSWSLLLASASGSGHSEVSASAFDFLF